ncbi:Hypothetical protein SRAE_1000031400 [Strongyloides ratti]|uniref:Uncharacterized protein n=1 Tax=Strongyloides ratti TaxID=34506 RepID=A0A090MU74_STRRB|nr:Hypothetical protein SRAE_1000031400 [Strongyloides ratti]CEF62038.1 Hypothetical protein SRAE_1000031400 [Strongyloides ratti]
MILKSVVLLIFGFLFKYCISLSSDNDFKVDLELIKHQPCAYNKEKSKWNKKIEFQKGTDKSGPKLVKISNQPPCFSLTGIVKVHETFRNPFSIYLEIRTSTNKKQLPEPCRNRQKDGCGGIGSCLYCNACEHLSNDIKNETTNQLGSLVKAKLLMDNKPMNCDTILEPGTYDNIQLAFCLPTLDEILISQGLTKEEFKTYIFSDDDGTKNLGNPSFHSIPLFATVYIFDINVKEHMIAQMKVEKLYKEKEEKSSKKCFFCDSSLPSNVYWNLPFNKIILENKEHVACHKIYGNVKISKVNN